MQIPNMNRYLLSVYVDSLQTLESSNISTHRGFGVLVKVFRVLILVDHQVDYRSF